MTHVPLPPSAAPSSEVLRIRSVHRATADLRRGVPVLIDGDAPLVVLAAEATGSAGLSEFAQATDGVPTLVLVGSRAVAFGALPPEAASRLVGFQTSPDLLDPESLRSLADPTAEDVLPVGPRIAVDVPPLSVAAIALAKLARLLPCVLVSPARHDALARPEAQGMVRVAAEDVLGYPAQAATSLVRVAEAAVPLENAEDARVVAFRATDSAVEHFAIVIGRPDEASAPNQLAPLVRLHSACFTGDVLGSLRCDCGPQLRRAIRRMAEEGSGVLLYLAQEGRGIGLVNKLRAYALQDTGLDTIDANQALGWGADERNFLVAATMLDALAVRSIRLLTNNPEKLAALAACGIRIVGRESHVVAPNGVNDDYLATKAERFGHFLGSRE